MTILIRQTFVTLFIVGTSNMLFAQVQKARLPRTINVPTKSHIYPSITSDESYMIFYSNYSNTGNYELKYTKKIGSNSWEEPQYIEHILKPGNDHFGSFNVSPNGEYLLFSSYRAGGIGKYDILISERSGNQWSQPVNPGKPLNSPGNDGNPSMSPDGRSIYFMRCEDMDESSKSGCSIYVSHKKSKRMWGEPEKLPSYINTGNTTSPRILSDNQTLIFSSERPGNKGKLDLYMTRLESGVWSQPIPLDIINSVRNDEFVSVPARGDIIYYTDVYKDQFNIALALLPQELRPGKVKLISGTINNRQLADQINVQAYDATTGNLVTAINIPEEESEFEIILPEGRIYDFSIFPLDGQHKFLSEIFDLKTIETSSREKMEFTVEQLRIGDQITLNAVKFDTLLNEVSYASELEFRRIKAIMQKNPSMVFEIQAYTDKPMVTQQIEIASPATTTDTTDLVSENLNTSNDASGSQYEGSAFDILDEPVEDENEGFIDLEEESKVYEDQSFETEYVAQEHMDTSQLELEKSFITQFEEKVIFDPDVETQKIAEKIVNKLISEGVPADRLKAVGMGYAPTYSSSEEQSSYWFKLKIGL